MIAAIVSPVGIRSIAMKRACLVSGPAAPSHHSNAPIQRESQSILSNIVARSPKTIDRSGEPSSVRQALKVCQALALAAAYHERKQCVAFTVIGDSFRDGDYLPNEFI